MQRVRVGLTGLACVFLLVLLAAAFLGLTNHDRVAEPLIVSDAAGPPGNVVVAETPREPLAELGVTPGFGSDVASGNDVADTAKPPPPAAPVRPMP